MKEKPKKPHELFDDLIERQKIIKAEQGHVTLEEARAIVKRMKEGRADKTQRFEKTKL